MNRKTALILIILIATTIPGALAETLTVSILESEDDVWMTEAGNVFGYESSVHILDGSIGLRAFLRFEDVAIAKSDKINLATLFVHAGWDQGGSPDPGGSVTIYGIAEPDCSPFSYSGKVWSLERPMTSAYVNWNLTTWGYGWHSVNVTDIVKEVVNRYAWEENNSLGLQILGASDSGQEVRTFEDIDHPHHGAYAYLYIQYNLPPGVPPGLPDTAVWEETYGEFDIWGVPGEQVGYPLDPIEYIFSDAIGYPYNITYDYIGNEGPPVVIQGSLGGAGLVEYSNARKLIRTSDGTLYAIYTHEAGINIEIHVKKSENNGTTWIGDTIVSAGLENRNQMWPAMAVDSEDNLHAVWEGQFLPIYTAPQTWYSKYNGASWSSPLIISNYTGMETYPDQKPSIAVDSEDNPHVVWFSRHGDFDNQIWYVTHNGTSWSSVLDISNDIPGMDTAEQYVPTIALDSQDNIYVAWYGQATEFGLETQIWIVNYTTSWGTPIHISTYAGMDDYNQFIGSIVLDSNDFIYVVWHGNATGFLTDYQIWCVNYTTSWGTPVRISTYAGMNETDQQCASIGIDTSDYLHVMWHGMATGHLDNDKVWYSNYTASWADPVVLQPVGKNVNPSIRWARFPDPQLGNDTFYLVDENNTVIVTWNGENFTDIDDLKDYTDDVINPGGDPLDPAPGAGWEETGPFTRFRMRLYFMIIGISCIFVPIWAISYKRPGPQGVAWCCMLILIGLGLLISIPNI